MYIDTGQVTVDGDVVAVTHHDDHCATEAEHATDLTVKNTAGLGAILTFYINTLVVKRHIVQTFYVVLSEMADNTVCSRDGHGQTTAVALEVATDAGVL